MQIYTILFAVCLCLGVLSCSAQEHSASPPEMFPFVIPWDDAARTVTDVSALNPAPIDPKRRIGVKSGHFVDQTGRRVRFLGTNFTFSANFPHKSDAEKIAARMRKYGFNCVRLHHMDMFAAPSGVFDPKAPGMRRLDPDQLDRLDYLLYQFKRHGIYVDLNLHVSRRPTAEDGFPDADRLPALGKVVSYFEPRFIQLQKEYVRDLLTHLNPYTKTRYADEPTIALIELTNEDTLLGEAWGGRLHALPPHYKGLLTAQWNDWLGRKYPSTEALRRAWSGGKPLGENLLKNARFEDGAAHWNLETHENARAAMQTVADGAASKHTLRLEVQALGGANWHVQFHQTGLDLEEGESYTVQFSARADKPRSLPVYTGLDIAPWRHVGLDTTVPLSTEWKRYSLTFTASQPEPNHNRLTFVLGEATGVVELADVSVREGILVEIPADQSLESKSISLPDTPNATPQGQDYAAFLMEVERKYAEGLKEYIQKTLSSKALVACSQASYGGLGGVWRESRMDWVDMHAYWQHPQFPPGKEWNPQEWTVHNVPMVRDTGYGTLAGLAMHRVEGKPFTVSEYNHPAPNDFRAEGLLMLAAYAAWQDWDGIFLFDYNGNRDEWKSERIKGFFSIDTDPARMALMPAAAMIFLRGDLKRPEGAKSVLTIPQQRVVALTARFGNSMGGVWGNRFRPDVPCCVRFVEGDGPVGQVLETGESAAAGARYTWHPEPANRAYFAVSSPRSLCVVGFGQDASMARVFRVEPTVSRDFRALSLCVIEGESVERARTLLLTAVGRVENTGMGWNAARNSVGDRWGTGPTLCEGISATVQIATRARQAEVFALDGTGKRVRSVPCTLREGRLIFEIGPPYKTVWYEVAAR